LRRKYQEANPTPQSEEQHCPSNSSSYQGDVEIPLSSLLKQCAGLTERFAREIEAVKTQYPFEDWDAWFQITGRAMSWLVSEPGDGWQGAQSCWVSAPATVHGHVQLQLFFD